MKANPLDTLPQILELAGVNLRRAGYVPTAAYLWIMKHPDTGEHRDEPGVLAPPGPTGDVDAWLRSVERSAIDLDAVAAILVTELRGRGERYLAVQYERRGEPVRLWRARISERRGSLRLAELRPDTIGVSTMTVLPADAGTTN